MESNQVILYNVQTIENAKNFILHMLKILGGGFHPDDSISDYTDRDGNQIFNDDQCTTIEYNLAKSFEVFESNDLDIYEFCCDNFHEVFE